MSYISNTLVIGCVDHIAAVLKAELGAVAVTDGLYDRVLREMNPDDIVNRTGDSSALLDDAAAEDGTLLYKTYERYLSFLNNRAADESYNSFPALLLARGIRVSDSFDTLCGPAFDTAIDASLIFSDDVVSLGTLAHGGTWAAGTALPCDLAKIAAIVTSAAIGTPDFVLSAGVTYSDDSEGTEACTITGLSSQDTVFPIGQLAVTTKSNAGQKVVSMSSTAGMVAGQKVLIENTVYPTLLTATATSGLRLITVSPTQVGAFRPGDAITLRDGTHNENRTILSIDYYKGEITTTANLTNSYEVADGGFVYLQSASSDPLRPGWQEIAEIDSVSENVSITLVSNLQHTYYTSAKVTRLVKSVEAVTATGGTAGDAIAVRSVVERTLTQ